MKKENNKLSPLILTLCFTLYFCLCILMVVISPQAAELSPETTSTYTEVIETTETSLAECTSNVETLKESSFQSHELTEYRKLHMKKKAYAYIEDFEKSISVANVTHEEEQIYEKEIIYERDPDNPYPVYNLMDNLSEWFLPNDNTTKFTLWKKTSEEGNLLLALRSLEGETLVTFEYDPEEYTWISDTFNDWVPCTQYYSEIMYQDIIDVTFTAYHEVSGNRAKGVQYQTRVIFNRDKSPDFGNGKSGDLDDGIRGVITQSNPTQYSCKNKVVNRRLKCSQKPEVCTCAEGEDLERCFRYTLLVFADELVNDVPDDVVWAATFRQGSGLWEYDAGTYYCHR